MVVREGGTRKGVECKIEEEEKKRRSTEDNERRGGEISREWKVRAQKSDHRV